MELSHADRELLCSEEQDVALVTVVAMLCTGDPPSSDSPLLGVDPDDSLLNLFGCLIRSHTATESRRTL